MSFITEIISLLKEVALLAFAVIASVTAIKGWRTWRRDLVVKDSREVARDLLRATYKIRDAIAACRSPFYSSQDFPNTRSPSTKERKAAWTYFFENRWKPVSQSRQEFYLAATEAEILWGIQIRDKTDGLGGCMRQLECAISDHLTMGAPEQSANPGSPSYPHSAIFASYKKDEFSQQVQKAIAEIEQQVRPHLEATQSNSRNRI